MNNMLLYMNIKKHIDKQIEDAKAIGKDINTIVFSQPVYTKFVKDTQSDTDQEDVTLYDTKDDDIKEYYGTSNIITSYKGLNVVILNRNDIILLVG
ncbi:hypothetical protein 015DV002_15 [Bacillus phage 015DV002]|nr:hypothetical protein 000TH008_17 [Bacillus phage 000TH008]QQO40711.1 hypothetical protein 000TH009_17 [Bacillus phage 000TH009]QQO40973.1 hypothetical protein 015DV002_15 [Bacillus phage 015DV002]